MMADVPKAERHRDDLVTLLSPREHSIASTSTLPDEPSTPLSIRRKTYPMPNSQP